MSVRPAKIQISLGILPVWSESLLCARWVAKDPRFLHADSEDSDQTGQMPRLIWVFAGCTLILLVLSCHGSYCIAILTVTISTSWYMYLHKVLMPLKKATNLNYLGRVKRICVFEHSVMTRFNCACPAIQRGQGSGFLSECSSWFTACMSEQRRFWRDCVDAQARLNLRCSHRR